MSRRHPPDFKRTQVFDWDHEPVDERPTDFGRSSTGYSTLSGYLVDTPSAARRRQRRDSRLGVLKLVLISSIILGLSIAVMLQMVRFLKG